MRARLARGAVWLAVLVVPGWTARAADGQVVRTYHLQAGLDVDAAGQVARVDLPATLPPVLGEPARASIRRWRFKPPVRAGQPVTARTYAWVDLDLVKRLDGTYGVAVSFIKNGPALALQAPRWPMEQGGGSLTMAAVVQPDGSLTDPALVASDFSSPLARKAFARAVEEAVRHSRALPELVDGKPVATRVRIPIAFRTASPSDVGEARADASAAQPAAPASESPDLAGQAIALDSPVQPLPPGPRG
ncbi:energy transducer TonB [Frateuria sp. MAH-13]|uniref:Energy transducer TonB n=1 Tax=Frateuria flava TaxID=2821489 RepID=A0ABS4DPJ1_9GAMM|nr:energy transducer TonB [Frateuria flava]MBP1474983.1 energy transducer TonB [Frateuria flava]